MGRGRPPASEGDAMHMSFALTAPQLLDGSKDVTRRLGWLRLTPGAILWAIRKGQGLKKGEHVERLARIKVISVRREPLNSLLSMDLDVARLEVSREGFPAWTPEQFVAFFCRTHNCDADQIVTRIEFRAERRPAWHVPGRLGI